MKNRKLSIIKWILAIFPLALIALVYSSLPAEIPQNWGMDGSVTYGAKSYLWLTGSLGLLFAFLLQFLPKIDPRRRNYEKFGTSYEVFCTLFVAFMAFVNSLVVYEALRPGSVYVSTVVTAATGLLFLFMGNMMPKIKSNFFVGFKTPWTLSSETVWNKTHRFGGFCMFIAGIVILIAAFFPSEFIKFTLILVAALLSAIIPLVMSYVWYKQEQDQAPEKNNK